ncbi:MAG: Fe-S protein assembly co-chaperone HscB [Phycisphaeraceae bacterium]|nr:Fe-S protein assembly co-chaperone HscB [Phycisphaeraceae bacterium]
MNVSPFELFDLPASYRLDADSLNHKFIELSARNHPDRFTDPLDQLEAAQRSATINAAYEILRDPHRRAESLLSILGGPSQTQDKRLPPELLEQMMDLREKEEQAAATGDQAALAELAQWARTQRTAAMDQIARSFEQAEVPGADRRKLFDTIRLCLNGLNYYRRMIDQIAAR